MMRLLLTAWGVAVAGGSFAMVRYQMKPTGDERVAVTYWPASLNTPRNPEGFTLLMMLHPRCPCSRASLHELEVLLARAPRDVDARIVFVQPPSAPPDWRSDGDLMSIAKHITAARLVIDDHASLATALGATTSGQILLYDRSGKLVFSGGITDGRGHEGDNPSLVLLLDILRGNTKAPAASKVYGCSLGVCTSAWKGNS
jgi:hypothetical protein